METTNTFESSAFNIEFAEEKTSKKSFFRKLVSKKSSEEKAAEIIKNELLIFESVTLAAQYLSELLGLKITNSKDCIYKALRGNGKTHKFNVSKNKENKIVLEPVISKGE